MAKDEKGCEKNNTRNNKKYLLIFLKVKTPKKERNIKKRKMKIIKYKLIGKVVTSKKATGRSGVPCEI